ncbi:MAG TPA: FtsX-like permease family protein [Solirubrobacteraceae bacterium]|jgi:putative ABC transport system permease protein|nr:FtsX-like permease family protein [Solirubrobacteraceae bacterium]
MGKLVLRGFAQRKVRALLTGIAIALGVALMAGTYILTDTINSAFAEVFGTAYKNKAVVVTERETLGRGSGSEISTLNESTLAKVRAVAGVATASGSVSTGAALLHTNGKRLTSGGAPGLVDGVQPARFESFKASSGHLPSAANQVAIDQATAQREHLKIGGQIVIAGRSPARTYTISGIAKFAGSESFGGTTVALVTISQAQYVAGEPGIYDGINVAASPAVSPEQLASRVRAALPSTLVVRTGAQEAANQTSELEEQLGFLRTFLLIFAYVALVVGAFIIFNTFSITVAQRTREFGLLRTLGASRAQVMRSVVFEGLLLGVGGAVAGLFIGIALAPALDQLFKAFGADLPDNGTVLETRTVIVSLAVGIVVTVIAGFFPALRATRVPPIAAMREGVSIPPRTLPSRRTLIIRGLVALIAVLVVSAATKSKVVLPVLLVVWAVRGAMLISRVRRAGQPRHYRIIPALGRGLGLIVSWRGIMGRLARENSVRQPGRTLVTALALTVGLGLVAFISVLAAGTKSTIDNAVGRSFAGSLIVQNTQSGQGIPPEVAPAVRSVPGVGSVTAVAFTKGRVRDLSKPGAPVIDEKSTVTAIEPQSFTKMYKAEWEHGSAATLSALRQDGTVITKKFASAHGLHVGDRLSVLTPSGHQVTLTVRGILKEEVLGLLTNLTITRALASAAFGQREDGVDFVSYSAGANATSVRGSINTVLKASFPQVHSQTAAQYTKEVSNKVDKFLLLVYVLLALSVLVSLFGIVNTLVLSIYERTRELGMMRAIGTSRRQIRQMIRYESLITGLIGGVLGLIIGVVGAVLVTEFALSGAGYVLSIPVGTLILLVIAAAIAGLGAAMLPARRAAKLDVLQALASE